MVKYYREREDNRVPVNRIIPFSAVDGPGNRTAIFLQGCNIDCKYCHNPETRNLCNGCLACVKECKAGAIYTLSGVENRVFYDKDKCVECDTCIQVCPHDASPKIQWLNAKEVFACVKKQVPFISGVTVSGGECMLYPNFLQELFQICKKEGLSTLIDSNGMVLFQEYEELLKVTDGVMLDIKTIDKETSLSVVGADNKNVLANASYLASIDKLEEIRTVIVEELLDASIVIEEIGDLLSLVTDLSKLRYKLIAFRGNGVREEYKYYKTPSKDYMKELEEIALNKGFKEIIII